MSLFLFRKESLVSIDIGFRNIKIIETCTNKDGSIEILNYVIVPTPRECIKNGHIKDITKMCEVIKRAILQNGVTAKHAKIVMSGTHIVSRLMSINLLNGQDEENLIKEFTVRNLPAVSNETHEIAYKIIASHERNNLIVKKIFVTAILKTITNSYVDLLVNLDLQPLSIEVPSQSINNFFRKKLSLKIQNDLNIYANLTKVEGVFCVIDFGSETTMVNILRDRILEFNKAILLGSTNIDENISRFMYRKVSEGEIIKEKYGLFIPDNFSIDEKDALKTSVYGIIDTIIDQILRCFDFYRSRCNGPDIEYIYIIGGGSRLKGLKEYLQQELKIPIFPIEMMKWENIYLNKRLDPEKIPYLINAVGIAMV